MFINVTDGISGRATCMNATQWSEGRCARPPPPAMGTAVLQKKDEERGRFAAKASGTKLNSRNVVEANKKDKAAGPRQVADKWRSGAWMRSDNEAYRKAPRSAATDRSQKV
jgi:hypothetical protein